MSRRQDVLHDYLQQWQRESSASWPTIATVVRETYDHMVDEHARCVPFSHHRDAYERSRLDAQTLRRLFERSEGFPMDLEEACVMALPDRYRQDCINELAARIGQHSGPMGDGDAEVFDSIGRFAKEFADVIEAVGPALADGHWGPEDMAYAARIDKELRDLIGMADAMRTDVRTKVLNHNVRSFPGRHGSHGD